MLESRVGRLRGAGRVVAGGLAAVGERVDLVGGDGSVSCVVLVEGLVEEASIESRGEVVERKRGAFDGRHRWTCCRRFSARLWVVRMGRLSWKADV